MSWETPLWWCVVANLLGNYLDASSVVKEDKMHCWSWFSYAEIMEFCLNRWLWDLDLTVLGSSFCVWSFFFFSCYYQTFPLRLIIQLSFSPIGRKGGIHWIRVARCLNCLFFLWWEEWTAIFSFFLWNLFWLWSVHEERRHWYLSLQRNLILLLWDSLVRETWGSEIRIPRCFESELTELHLSLLLLQDVELKTAGIIGCARLHLWGVCMNIGNIRSILPY